MYAFSDDNRNKITLSQLLAFYHGDKIIFGNIEEELLPKQLRDKLGFVGSKGTTVSNVRNGIAFGRFKACANAFEDEHAHDILEKWDAKWGKILSKDGDTGETISPQRCAERIINGERETLEKICPDLLRWLDNAIQLNSDEYLKKVFSVLTILAITRNKTGENWRELAKRLMDIPDFLPMINVLSEEPSPEAQKALEKCTILHKQGDLEQAKNFRDTALEENKLLWKSSVWREWAKLQSSDAFDSYMEARACLEDALAETDTTKLRRQWLEISEEFLRETITRLKQGDESFLADFEKNLPDEEFYRHWYGTAYFRLATFYKECDEKNFMLWLKRGINLNDPESLNLQMELLWPLNDTETHQGHPDPQGRELAKQLAEQLQNSSLPKIKGNANWRLYLITEDESKRERYLQVAYESDFPQAIKEHNKGVVSYVKDLKKATCAEGGQYGQYFLNVDKEHLLAKIFLKTVPENWTILPAAGKTTAAQFICLLIDESSQKNLQDFLTLLQSLKENPPQNTTIYVRGERDLLTPILDTALKQFYHEKKAPLLRVEILDDDLDPVRHLFGHRPLFLPLLNGNSKQATTLHLMVVGSTKLCLQAVREADWFMTFPAELKIKSKITLVAPRAENQLRELRFSTNLSDKIEAGNVLLPGLPHPTGEFKDLGKVISLAVEAGEALYFVVDVGNDLQNLSLAIEIRKILTRAYLKFSKTLPCTPIGFSCKNVDFAFMSRRLIVLGEERSDGNFNNHHLIPMVARYTWQELISNNIDSRLAVAVHMVYFNVHAGENFSDSSCREAFLDFSRRTYNQRSSLAVAQSLMTRVFVIERLLGVKIFDETWQNTPDFFSATNRKKILENEIISSLKEFYELLKTITAKLKSIWNKIQEFGFLTAWREFSVTLDKFIAQKDFPTCERLKKFNGKIEEVTFNEAVMEKEDRRRILDKIMTVLDYIESKLKSVEQIFIFEHQRWATFLQASEGWQSVTSEEAIKYINLGNNEHHQNYLTKQHPCLVDWCHLNKVADDLNPALGTKDFKKYDIESVLATGEFLSKSIFCENSETPKSLRRLFCVTKEDLTL